MRRSRLSRALLAMLVSLTVRSAWSADASPDQWERRTFQNPREAAAIMHSYKYGLQYWDAGDHTVPRLYVARIPEQWRKVYGPKAAVSDKKRFFLFIFAPLILRSNELILEERAQLEALLKKPTLTESERMWLKDLAVDYGLATPQSTLDVSSIDRVELLTRVDVVPISLALAQAATESGWGTSRFADEGNALFGQWTWSKSAMIPEDARAELGHYGVRAFESPFHSIAAYMDNLNSHARYAEFRARRAAARAAGKPASGLDLVDTLDAYSERGAAYVKEIHQMILRNRLAEADGASLRTMNPVLLEPVGEQSR
jgi:Bax protein